jgi:hydroxymethylglutaryl-CoA reductase (NADPH)
VASRQRPGPAALFAFGHIDTDKKQSQMNTITIRGKRVVAEVVVQRDVPQRLKGVDTAEVFRCVKFGRLGPSLLDRPTAVPIRRTG